MVAREGDTDRYERALESLYRASLAEFIALRGRLATELRGQGERPSAARLVLRRRPTISAWAVNQLYWRARDDFDRMRAAAERLRAGELDATDAYRRALAVLRRRAADLLKENGHAAGDAVLARVTNTLAAIAATGFEPDAPGTLSADRDPPGFDIGPVGHRARSADVAPRAEHRAKRRAHGEETRAAAREGRRVTELAERRLAAEQARQARERQRLERELAAARAEVDRRERACEHRRAELRAAETAVAEARERMQALASALQSLDDAPGIQPRRAGRGAAQPLT